MALALLALLAPDSGARAEPGLDAALARADAAWARRSEDRDGARADPQAARRAVRVAQAAREAHPESLAAAWRVLRALFFQGEFAAPEEAARRGIFDEATEVAEAALARLAARLPEGRGLGARLPDVDDAEIGGGGPALREALEGSGVASGDAARLHFWAAVGWGGRSRSHGVLDAVRNGAAGRIRENGRVAAALEPGVDRGGPLRLLARLHAELPRVPFVSGWVDRSRPLRAAERALEIAPDFAGNPLTLALTILDVAPAQRARARRLLEQAAAVEPVGAHAVELAAIRERAHTRLASLESEGR